MKIFLGADHAGFELKEKIKFYLFELGHEVEDFGASFYNEGDDYPDFIRQVADAVAKDPENSRGIVLGGSGQGEAIVANRISGVRAVVLYTFNEQIVRLSREHNNANVLALGARFLSEDDAKKIVKLWLDTPFSKEERHKRRINKIARLPARQDNL
ncbi:MAG: ribose 5-phosphate isomerase B [Parcubacteria group bacterium Athens0714_24]|nr:MAG: ribose 5-phosphate isomerase B [Parcubacteria group bacterium Athens0714_24]